MPIVVNSNVTATTASFNLSRANDALRNSLARLSSGKRIVNPADDTGGMALTYKLQSKLQRIEAARQNIQNSLSYLQVQDDALQVMGKVLDRMSELRNLAQDVTKNTGDVENYTKEFIELQRQLNQTAREKFNGISLFASSSARSANNPPCTQLSKGTTVNDEGVTERVFSRTLYTNPSGQALDGNVSIGVINLQNLFRLDGGLDAKYASGFNTAASILSTPFFGPFGLTALSEGVSSAHLQALGLDDSASLWDYDWARGGVSGGGLDFMDGGYYSAANASYSVSVHSSGVKFPVVMSPITGQNTLANGSPSMILYSIPDKLPNSSNLNGSNLMNYGSISVYNDFFTSDGFLSSILFVSVGQFTTAIERLADARAENGSEQARLKMSNELLIYNQSNLETAYGRIMDAYITLESTRFARQNVLVQSSAALVAQSNQLTSIALTILG